MAPSGLFDAVHIEKNNPRNGISALISSGFKSDPIEIQFFEYSPVGCFEGFLRRLPVTLKHVVDGDGRKDVAEVAVDSPGWFGKWLLLNSSVSERAA